MESYLKDVRSEIARPKIVKKIKIQVDKFDSEECFIEKPQKKNKIPVEKYDSAEAFSEKPFNCVVQNGKRSPKLKKKQKLTDLLSPSTSELSVTDRKRQQDFEVIEGPSTSEITPKKKKCVKFKPSPTRLVDSDAETIPMEVFPLKSHRLPEKVIPKHRRNIMSLTKKTDVNENLKSPKKSKKPITPSFNDLEVKPMVIEENSFDFDEFVDNHSGVEEISEIEEDLGSIIGNLNLNYENNDSPKYNESCASYSEEEPEIFDIEETPFIVEEHFKQYDVIHGKLLVISPQKPVVVHGYMKVKVLHGNLHIFGQILKPLEEFKIYSPRGTALLSLECFISNVATPAINLKTPYYEEDVEVPENSLVVYCSPFEDPIIDFLEDNISQQIFPKINQYLPVVFNPSNLPVIKINPEWDRSLADIKKDCKIMIVGGKGVGKSTFLRYAINKLLTKFSVIRIIDLDPGQSEFTVPGCVSIVTVDGPIYSPNYLHLRKPDRSILSNINVGNAPQSYIKAIETLMEYNGHLEPLPTIINYMGFTAGIGINLVSAAICVTQPTLILQIRSTKKSKNFPCSLTKENVVENCGLLYRNEVPDLSYKFLELSSMSDFNEGWSLEPRQMREMCILAYFGQLMDERTQTITSCRVKMFKVGLSSISLIDCQGNKVAASSANANLVALCSPERGNFVCHGWGIVRGIDVEGDYLVVITPESEDVLNKVDCLVVGCLSLPPSLYMNTRGVSGFVPYVMKGELEALSQFTKRIYKPPNKK